MYLVDIQTNRFSVGKKETCNVLQLESMKCEHIMAMFVRFHIYICKYGKVILDYSIFKNWNVAES